MDFEDWMRRNEREMGAVFERLRSVENADAALRTELRDGFAKQERALADGMRLVGDSVLRESAHTRGEISRLDLLYQENRRNDEMQAIQRRRDEDKRNADLIETLKAQAAAAEAAAKDMAQKAARENRPFVAFVVAIGLALQWLVQNAGTVSTVLENFPR